MEHGLIMFRPAIVRDILPVEWTRTSRRPCGLVYINIPGRTCLHELFEQVTAWVARFFFPQNGGRLSYTISRHLHWMVQWEGAQVAATTVSLTSNCQLEGTIGRVAGTAHTGSFITHAAVTSTFCGFTSRYQHQWYTPYAMVNMENLKANSSSRLETRGLQWYDLAKLAGFNEFKNSGSLKER